MSSNNQTRTLYVVRHAEREDNINPHWNATYTGFASDNSPLSARGRRQAEDLRKYFERIDIRALYSSNFHRTLQTASILSHDHPSALKINVEPGLAELLGLCESPPGFWPIEKLKTKFKTLNVGYTPICPTPLPHEGFDCNPRLKKTIDGILEHGPQKGAIVIVSHLSSIDSIFNALGHNHVCVGQATISIFEETAIDSSKFKCTARASCAHLCAENRENLR